MGTILGIIGYRKSDDVITLEEEKANINGTSKIIITTKGC